MEGGSSEAHEKHARATRAAEGAGGASKASVSIGTYGMLASHGQNARDGARHLGGAC